MTELVVDGPALGAHPNRRAGVARTEAETADTVPRRIPFAVRVDVGTATVIDRHGERRVVEVRRDREAEVAHEAEGRVGVEVRRDGREVVRHGRVVERERRGRRRRRDRRHVRVLDDDELAAQRLTSATRRNQAGERHDTALGVEVGGRRGVCAQREVAGLHRRVGAIDASRLTRDERAHVEDRAGHRLDERAPVQRPPERQREPEEHLDDRVVHSRFDPGVDLRQVEGRRPRRAAPSLLRGMRGLGMVALFGVVSIEPPPTRPVDLQAELLRILEAENLRHGTEVRLLRLQQGLPLDPVHLHVAAVLGLRRDHLRRPVLHRHARTGLPDLEPAEALREPDRRRAHERLLLGEDETALLVARAGALVLLRDDLGVDAEHVRCVLQIRGGDLCRAHASLPAIRILDVVQPANDAVDVARHGDVWTELQRHGRSPLSR